MPRLSNQSATVLEAEDLTAYGPARATVQGAPLSSEELRKIDAYWRASLYLCLGMLYLKDNRTSFWEKSAKQTNRWEESDEISFTI